MVLTIPLTHILIQGFTGTQGTQPPRGQRDSYSPAERTTPLRDLLVEKLGNDAPSDLESLSGTQLRDRLLDVAPSDRNWVARVNQVRVVDSCLIMSLSKYDDMQGAPCFHEREILHGRDCAP